MQEDEATEEEVEQLPPHPTPRENTALAAKIYLHLRSRTRQPCTLKSLLSHGAQAGAHYQRASPVKATSTARALAGVCPSQASAPATLSAEMPITLPMRNSVLALRAMRPRPSLCHEGRPDIRAGYAAAALDAAFGVRRRRRGRAYPLWRGI